MTRSMWVRTALLAGVAVTLAGCGGGGSSSVSTPNAPAVVLLEDKFGTQFGVDFRASANSEPVKPATSDIVALSLTSEPLPLH